MAGAGLEQRLAYWQHYKYYEGHLDIKVPKSGYEKRWVVLLGNEIHLYTSKIPQREQGSAKPIQHYPLHPSTAISLDSDYKMYIKCELWTIRAKATSNEERENWRIRILTIAKGEAPDQGKLLPGQQELLADILQKEVGRKHNHGRGLKARRGSSPGHLQHSGSPSSNFGRQRNRSFNEPSHEYTDNLYYRFLPDDIAFSQMLPPVWFFGKISRAKAEGTLHQSTSNGDLLLRESEAHPGQYTLSVRQDTDSKSLIRHYMFKKDPYGSGFILLIEDKPPVLSSMYELMWFFIQESGGHLLPIQKDPNLPPPNYDTSVPVKDQSNGETTASMKRQNFIRKSYTQEGDFPQSSSRQRTQEIPLEPEDDYLVPDVPQVPEGRRVSAPAPTVPSAKSPLRSVSESIDEPDDTYAPATGEDDMPRREAPLPPPPASHSLPSAHLMPPSSASHATTGYVKMRSFQSSPTLAHRPVLGQAVQEDVGYINMKRQSDAQDPRRGDSRRSDGGGGGSGGGEKAGDDFLVKSLIPPPLPRKSRSHHGYCTHLKSVPEEETGIASPILQHLKTPLRPTNSCPPEASFHVNTELHKAFKRFGLREESST